MWAACFRCNRDRKRGGELRALRIARYEVALCVECFGMIRRDVTVLEKLERLPEAARQRFEVGA